tara:strand:- start:2050 stop:2433 length:384 start_codon:yes stop_codon:yes gene_type:complete
MPKESFNLTPHTAGVFDAEINEGDVVLTARFNINNASSAEIERLLTLLINFDDELFNTSQAEQSRFSRRVLERGLMQVVKELRAPNEDLVDFLDVLRGEAYQLLDPILDAGHLDKAVFLDPPHDIVP